MKACPLDIRWEHFCDLSDARVLAEQQIWAVVTDNANHAFNCTNGDVFTWKSLWKVLCEVFDVELVPFDENEKFNWVGMMKEKGRVWDEIVEKYYGLYKTNLEEIVCVEAVNAILHFEFQNVCSMNKTRIIVIELLAHTFSPLGTPLPPLWPSAFTDQACSKNGGLGIDAGTGRLDAADEWWTRKIAACPNAGTFRKKGMPNLDSMDIIAHENNDGEHANSAGGTYGRSEGGHYDAMADVISMLDETEMREVRNNITASICS
ncbi:hypothetical protein CMV_004075 [Castanea mollissima]|uniref:Uncharacterized protein n=1 Tax=Castanea mollissima TaxID=60419 RepID=A0A8J4VUG4_9ROSI|nr:hypothetical protein CMV_004075 [Castanea mollissima]